MMFYEQAGLSARLMKNYEITRRRAD